MADAPKFADLSKIDPNMPMRLDVIAKLAFPDGSIGYSALRTEARKGRLVTFRIANKDMTTLAEIEAMKKLCLIRSTEPAPRPNTPLRSVPEDRGAIARDAALAKVRSRREQLSSDDRMAHISEPLKRARETKSAADTAETAAKRRRRPPTP